MYKKTYFVLYNQICSPTCNWFWLQGDMGTLFAISYSALYYYSPYTFNNAMNLCKKRKKKTLVILFTVDYDQTLWFICIYDFFFFNCIVSYQASKMHLLCAIYKCWPKWPISINCRNIWPKNTVCEISREIPLFGVLELGELEYPLFLSTVAPDISIRNF